MTLLRVPLVVGLGSNHGDDQAGWLVVRELQRLQYPPERLQSIQESSQLLNLDLPSAGVVICDACVLPMASGSSQHFQWPDPALLDLKRGGSHDLGLPEVLRLYQQLVASLPPVEIWAIAGSCWTPGTAPTVQIQAAASRVAQRILLDIGLATPGDAPPNV